MCPDERNRIQCVELKRCILLLLVSVYTPSNNQPMISDNIEDFQDCLDQLNEICQKVSLTQKLIIGGDFHEDFSFLLLYKAWRCFASTCYIYF